MTDYASWLIQDIKFLNNYGDLILFSLILRVGIKFFLLINGMYREMHALSILITVN